MKPFRLLLTMGVLLCLPCMSVARAETSTDRLILTEGTAEATGQNDSARISVAVLSVGRTVEEAASENAAKTKEVLGAVKRLNIENLKLKTSGFRLTPQRDYGKSRPPVIKGYEAFNAVEATMELFEPEVLSKNVSKIIEAALTAGANDIQYVQFYIRNKEPLEKEALTQATRQALERAGILARAAGVKLKGIVSISTQPVSMAPRMLRAAEMKADSAAMAPPMEAGESQVRAHVQIACEFE